jgi:hypothetical protein
MSGNLIHADSLTWGNGGRSENMCAYARRDTWRGSSRQDAEVHALMCMPGNASLTIHCFVEDDSAVWPTKAPLETVACLGDVSKATNLPSRRMANPRAIRAGETHAFGRTQSSCGQSTPVLAGPPSCPGDGRFRSTPITTALCCVKACLLE